MPETTVRESTEDFLNSLVLRKRDHNVAQIPSLPKGDLKTVNILKKVLEKSVKTNFIDFLIFI